MAAACCCDELKGALSRAEDRRLKELANQREQHELIVRFTLAHVRAGIPTDLSWSTPLQGVANGPNPNYRGPDCAGPSPTDCKAVDNMPRVYTGPRAG